MSDYNWCHNPDCHTIHTQSRVRGTGTNKVLRTVKIKVGRYNYSNDNSPNIYDYFCNQNCLHDFLRKFCREVANLIQQQSQRKHRLRLQHILTIWVIVKVRNIKVITPIDND